MMQKNSRKLVLGALLTSAAMGFNATGRADCDPMTAKQMLEDGAGPTRRRPTNRARASSLSSAMASKPRP